MVEKRNTAVATFMHTQNIYTRFEYTLNKVTTGRTVQNGANKKWSSMNIVW